MLDNTSQASSPENTVVNDTVPVSEVVLPTNEISQSNRSYNWLLVILSVGTCFFLAGIIILLVSHRSSPSQGYSGQLNQESTLNVAKKIGTIQSTLTPISTKSIPQNTPTLSISPMPTATPVPFDSTIGNNPVAALFAQKIMDSFNQTNPGVIQNIYMNVNFDPDKLKVAQSVDEKMRAISDASINIQVDSTIWENTTDSVKKDFVATLITITHNNYYVYPDVTISDGFRTVAKGSWSFWHGEPDITLE